MSLILKGIDLPKEEINLTITKDGRIYLDNKYHLIAVAIQIPNGHGAIKDTGEIIKLFRRAQDEFYSKRRRLTEGRAHGNY